MAEEPVQTYENYVRYDKVIFTVFGIYLLAIILAAVGIFFSATLPVALGVIAAGFGGALGAVMARGYSTKLQDRIIRLEMRLRMREVLPDELAADIMDFKLPQLIALRFASDDELPELARKVLDEDITNADDIKRLIHDWQADWHRI